MSKPAIFRGNNNTNGGVGLTSKVALVSASTTTTSSSSSSSKSRSKPVDNRAASGGTLKVRLSSSSSSSSSSSPTSSRSMSLSLPQVPPGRMLPWRYWMIVSVGVIVTVLVMLLQGRLFRELLGTGSSSSSSSSLLEDMELLPIVKHVEFVSHTPTTTTVAGTVGRAVNDKFPFINHYLWESPDMNLPAWLKEYFTWHSQQRHMMQHEWKPRLAKLTDKDPQQAADFLYHQQDQLQFLVIRCFSFDRKCGGLADRLLPLPYLLQLAHNTSRLLLIHFQKPAPLEAYLVPPQGGVDWRIPNWLLPAFNFTRDSRRYKAVHGLEGHAHYRNETVVQSILQAYHYGSQPYEERRLPHEPTFRHVTRDIWRCLLTPTLALQQVIRQELTALSLIEGHYTAIHCRVLYAVQEHQRTAAQLQSWTRNAIHCATHLSPTGPFFIASDSSNVTRWAVQYSASSSDNNNRPNVRIVARTHTTPLHFDRIPVIGGGNYKAAEYVPEDYYDTYVDLMIMAMAKCVTHGIGGYGRLASFLSYNESCSNRHFDNKKKMVPCSWNENTNTNAAIGAPKALTKPTLQSLLVPPMD